MTNKNLSKPSLKYSVVIPVFNSENVVAKTTGRVIGFFESHSLEFEIILVDDGSTDKSWAIISDLANRDARIKALNLLKNFGQHSANLCGFRYSTGDYVITMDDDLQNPPEEIVNLINKAGEGFDLVVGQFREKKHELYRRLGSKLISWMNEKIFGKPKELVLTNFRLIKRDVVDRICAHQTSFPYIPGLALMMSSMPANVLVEHHAREEGESNYSLARLLRLVSTILFNHSSFPLRLVAAFGLLVSLLSLVVGLVYLIQGIFVGTSVPGWTSLVVLLSFYNGVLMAMVGILGEYTIRILAQSNGQDAYHLCDVVDLDKNE